MVEIQPDSFAVSTRFHAEHTLLGDVKQTCTLLTEKIGALSWKREKHSAIRSAQAKFARYKRTSQGLSRYFDEYDHYELLMVQSNPLAPPSYHAEISNRSDIDEAKINIYKNQSDKLWNDLHQGKVRNQTLDQRVFFASLTILFCFVLSGEKFLGILVIYASILIVLRKKEVKTTVIRPRYLLHCQERVRMNKCLKFREKRPSL